MKERAALEGLAGIQESLDLLYAVWAGLLEKDREFLPDSEATRRRILNVEETLENRRRILTSTGLEIALRRGGEVIDDLADAADQVEAHKVVADRLLVRLEEMRPGPDLGQFEPDVVTPEPPDLGTFEPVPVIPHRSVQKARPGSGIARALGVLLGVGALAGLGALADSGKKTRKRRRRVI